MQVKDIMTRKLVTVGFDDPLETVKQIFDNVRIHHLLVVEDGELFGILSDRDLLKAISPNLGTTFETYKDRATLNKHVHQIMSRDLVSLGTEASVVEAIRIFNERSISCIPILDAERKPVGILSWRDIMRALVERPADFTELLRSLS
jgi:acetoin utilization protein AcuB